MMKAVYIEQLGGLDRLQVGDLPAPRANGNQIVLHVKAAALNHLDIRVRNGRPGVELLMPHVLGSDAAGVVAETGPGVDSVKVGDEVILNPGLSCGRCEFCCRGEHSECLTFGIIGMSGPGTFAEYVVVPAINVYPKPAHLTFEEAAALPLAHVTAWRMLMTRAQLRPGETVLIHGIGGGVALAALQWAKLASACVIVTSSSEDKLDRAKALGADFAINYRVVSDVGAAVREITDGRGVDIVVDTVGAATWAANFAAVRRGGRVVICGVTGGAEVQANLAPLYWNQVSVLGSTMGSHEDFRGMVAATSAARLRPVLDSVEPFERAREAQARMETGKQCGKIVLVPR